MQNEGVLLLSIVLRLALAKRHGFGNGQIQTTKREGINMVWGQEEENE